MSNNPHLDRALARGPLTGLSLTYLAARSRVPSPPTNAERLQTFRAVAEPVIGNGFNWRSAGERYAREQMADGSPDCRNGFDFKYGVERDAD